MIVEHQIHATVIVLNILEHFRYGAENSLGNDMMVKDSFRVVAKGSLKEVRSEGNLFDVTTEDGMFSNVQQSVNAEYGKDYMAVYEESGSESIVGQVANLSAG